MREQALRHEGTKASRAFSLVEVLMAIVILGIGIISIAALFPAGIAQQRLSNDDFMGPTVANHAISIIRSKVSPEDFGTYEEFNPNSPDFPVSYFARTIPGDWAWMRPGFLFASGGSSADLRGAIDIFSNIRTGSETGLYTPVPNIPAANTASENYTGWHNILYGIPYNTERYESGIPPKRIITQTERYYPMRSQLLNPPPGEGIDPARPQYVWECMFRRYNGRILVAIFVYRVSVPGGGAAQSFIVQPNPSDNTIPPVPIAIDLVDPPAGWNGPDPWTILYENFRPMSEVHGFSTTAFDPLADNQSWQTPRQWILDQNNNIHRVVSYRREGTDMRIELTRPLAPVRLAMLAAPDANEDDKYDDAPDTSSGSSPNWNWPTFSPHEYFGDPSDGPEDPTWNQNLTGNPLMRFPLFDKGIVTRFWYIPTRMEISADEEYTLTPVYVTVKEL